MHLFASATSGRMLDRVLRSKSWWCHFKDNIKAPAGRTIRTISSASSPQRGSDETEFVSRSYGNSGRIYVLGIGNIGKLFSHALATKHSPPPITLLLHRTGLLQAWEDAGRKIEIVTDAVSNKDGTFDVESIHAEGSRDSPNGVIDNLILATKAAQTVPALNSLKNRLGHTSTILFTQNGMGSIEEVSKAVFPDLKLRPRYLACVTSHGVYSQGPFSSIHAGIGTVAIGTVTGESANNEQPSHILQQIVEAPLLAAKQVSSVELTRLQLEKLVINAMINPLTVIFNRPNGELFTSSNICRLMRLLLAEASDVISSLPELKDDQFIRERFAPPRLADAVYDMARKTAKNTSSMLQDVQTGRETEIDYINGYIVRRGAELGIDCDSNERLVQMVKDVRVIDEGDIAKYFPDFM